MHWGGALGWCTGCSRRCTLAPHQGVRASTRLRRILRRSCFVEAQPLCVEEFDEFSVEFFVEAASSKLSERRGRKFSKAAARGSRGSGYVASIAAAPARTSAMAFRRRWRFGGAGGGRARPPAGRSNRQGRGLVRATRASTRCGSATASVEAVAGLGCRLLLRLNRGPASSYGGLELSPPKPPSFRKLPGFLAKARGASQGAPQAFSQGRESRQGACFQLRLQAGPRL